MAGAIRTVGFRVPCRTCLGGREDLELSFRRLPFPRTRLLRFPLHRGPHPDPASPASIVTPGGRSLLFRQGIDRTGPPRRCSRCEGAPPGRCAGSKKDTMPTPRISSSSGWAKRVARLSASRIRTRLWGSPSTSATFRKFSIVWISMRMLITAFSSSKPPPLRARDWRVQQKGSGRCFQRRRKTRQILGPRHPGRYSTLQ